MKKIIIFPLYLLGLTCILSQEIEREVIPLYYDTSGYQKRNTSSGETGEGSSPTTSSGEVIPSINSEMEVNNSGALVYTVPVEVFNGINNFQPNLALSYSSQSGNGQAGWGWNIIGLSSITQGGTSKEIEGITRGPQYTDSDPFYLDGQRLVKTGENSYETRLFSKLIILRNSEGYSFIVKYPDGKIGKYKQLVYGQHYISAISDALGHETHYEYSVTSNVPYIKSISYGGASVSTDTYKIEFTFKNRTYPAKMYRNGLEYLNDKILSQIIVSSSYDGIYRKYLLTHDILSNRNERLRTIEIENKQGEKLKPLNFNYNTSDHADINLITQPIQRGNINPKKLGSVAIGDFKGNGTPYPIYCAEVDGGYVMTESSIRADADTQIFVGKALFDDQKITDRDQLIAVNTEYITRYEPSNSMLFPSSLLPYIGDVKNVIDFYKESVATGTLLGGIPVANGISPIPGQRSLILHTPKIKVTISVYDPLTQRMREVYFQAKGNYFGNVEEKCYNTTAGLECQETPALIGEKNKLSKDLGKRRIIVGDFNNDGLTDILIQNKPSSCFKPGGGPTRERDKNGIYTNPLTYINQCYARESTFYFIEIGKIQQNGAITPEVFISEANHLGTPIEFDGDGIPELIFPAQEQLKYEAVSYNPSQPRLLPLMIVLKVDTQAKKISKVNLANTGNLLTHNDYTEPVFYGDFNGDGLTDFMIPRNVFEVSGNNGAQLLWDQINSSKLIWYLYTNTGKEFQRKELDLTQQKLAYVKPSDRDIIKKSSGWEKFWSGKPDKYQYSEYATSYIIPTDIDNDGKTDLISIRKFTKLKPNSDYIFDITVDNLLSNNIQANKITILSNKTDANQNTVFTEVESVLMQTKKISPFSLLIGNADYTQLNTFKSGVRIYDLGTSSEFKLEINNDNFTETHLKGIDNGSGVTQTIEYRPMISNDTYTTEKAYSVSASDLRYPYYIHNKQGTYYFAHKINTLFDGKSLTTEYRYQNGIQQLEGKGFLGFQKTYVSNPYESELINGKYYKKDLSGSPVFWKINTFDPELDHSLVKTTYGSADGKSVFTESALTYNKYDKGSFRYLILPIAEKNSDLLKKVESEKTYTYDPATLYLKEAYTSAKDGFSTSSRETYSYKPDFTNGSKYFSGKIEKTETLLSRSGATFSTKEEYTYNNNGQVIQSKKYGNNTDAISTAYTYDNYGNILTGTVSTPGVSSLTSKYEYDATHRYVVKVTSPEGLSTTQNINTLGQMISETSALGLTTNYVYDSWNNPKETTDYLGHKTSLEKTALDNGKYQLTTQIAGQAPAIAVFDKFDRKIQIRTLVMGKWLYADTQYDLFGKVIKTSEPYYEGETPLWNTTEYDDLNRPVKETLYTGKVITTCYEGLKVTVQNGHKKISRTLDASGHTIEHNDSGGKIQYIYYPNGALKEAGYDGMVIKNEQDGWGNKTKTIDPSAGTYEYQYDNFGRLFKETTPKGSTTITYDAYGKVLTEVTEGDGASISKAYTYDSKTKLPTKIAGYSNGKSYAYETYYDSYYRIKGKKDTTPYLVSESNSTFDSYGRADITSLKTTVTEIGYTTTSQVRNEYNAYGELIRQWDAGTNKLIREVQSINSHGQVTQMKYGNGYTLTNTYNNWFYLQNIIHKNGSLTAVNMDYDYDVLKGVLKSRNNKNFSKNESFEYDQLDRLLKERVNNVLINEYTYDKRGRMTYNSNIGSYQYANNSYQLNQITFNNPGTQLKQNRGFHEVTYNAFKSPMEVYLPNKDRIQFEYGILETRSAMYYGNTDTNISSKPNRKYYTSDGSVEVTKTGNQYKVVTYINGDGYSASYIKIEELTGNLLKTSKKYFLHRDNQGSIVAITDAESGAISEQRFFDAWGNLTSVIQNGIVVPIPPSGAGGILLLDRGYTGHEHLLSVGLINMNARLYDPQLRRFLSPDNFVQEPYNTQNYNRYGYVLNNPLLYTDPSGEEFFTAVLIGVGVAILTNGINNGIQGKPFWHGIGKSATIGGVSGAISMGIGAVASSISTSVGTVGTAAIQAGMHGVTGGIMSSIDGGNFLSGFASGAISSVISSGIEGLGTSYAGGKDLNGNYGKNAFGKSSTFKAVMIASGGLSGGISSSIAGGNFWSGARQGLITSGLNHAADWVTEPKYFKLKYTTTNSNTENGLTDIAKPELELKIKGRISDGEITSFSLDITNSKGLISDTDFVKGKAGDYYKELLNDSKVKIDGGYKYNIGLEGTIESKINIPGKIGKFLPTSVDFKFNFSFSYSYSGGVYPSILTNHKFKYSMGKYDFWTDWMGVTSREYVELY